MGAWEVTDSRAQEGWGPFLYDIAMEYATLHGNGLMADRDHVSYDARRVWDVYYNHRTMSDVGIHNLADDCAEWHDEPSLQVAYTKNDDLMQQLQAAGRLLEI